MAEVKKVKLGKIIRSGLATIRTQKLNADFTDYEEEFIEWQGHTEFEFTPTRTKTELPSGDDPAWMTKKGLVTGKIKIKFYALPIEAMQKMFKVKYSAADGLCVGDTDDPDNFIGMTVETTVTEQIEKNPATESKNLLILYKAEFELPTISAKTVGREDTAVADVEVTGMTYPVFFSKKSGAQGARTYSYINSAKQAEKYAAHQKGIAFPAEMTQGE